jgi:hypothetical protein
LAAEKLALSRKNFQIPPEGNPNYSEGNPNPAEGNPN